MDVLEVWTDDTKDWISQSFRSKTGRSSERVSTVLNNLSLKQIGKQIPMIARKLSNSALAGIRSESKVLRLSSKKLELAEETSKVGGIKGINVEEIRLSTKKFFATSIYGIIYNALFVVLSVVSTLQSIYQVSDGFE